MKKIVLFALCIIMIFSLVSCIDNADHSNDTLVYYRSASNTQDGIYLATFTVSWKNGVLSTMRHDIYCLTEDHANKLYESLTKRFEADPATKVTIEKNVVSYNDSAISNYKDMSYKEIKKMLDSDPSWSPSK